MVFRKGDKKMLDWTKRTEAIVNTLIGAQKKLWETGIEGVRSIADATMDERWEETVGVTRKMVHNTIKAQGDLRDEMVKTVLSIESLPEQATETIEEFQEMSKELMKSQEGILENCFDMMVAVNPTRFVEPYAEALKGPMESVQKVAQRTIETQLKMVREWTGKPKAEKPAVKKEMKTPRKKKVAKRKPVARKPVQKKETEKEPVTA